MREKILAKYGGLKYVDSEDTSKIGTFLVPNCAELTKCRKGVTREQRIQGNGWFYALIGVHDGFNSELNMESQENFVGTWEREWGTFEMIVDHYNQFPDPKLRLNNEGECDDE